MLKTTIAICAIGFTTGGMTLWLKSVGPTKEQPLAAATMPSVDELHARVRLEDLPVHEFKDPF